MWRAPLRHLLLVFLIEYILTTASVASGSCGDWLAGADAPMTHDVLAGLSPQSVSPAVGLSADVWRAIHAGGHQTAPLSGSSSAPLGPVPPCHGPDCRRAPGDPLPVPVPRLELKDHHSLYLLSGTAGSSDLGWEAVVWDAHARASRGFPQRLERPPRW